MAQSQLVELPVRSFLLPPPPPPSSQPPPPPSRPPSRLTQLPLRRPTYSNRAAQLQNCINIGIDFGTTYSGVAWALSGARVEEINVVTDWKILHAVAVDVKVKVPTEISYERGGIRWGYDIPPEVEPLKWFKLLLLQEKDMKESVRNSIQVRRAREMLARQGKGVVDVVADYLGFLWDSAMKDIGKQLSRESVDGTPFRVRITVPAIWPAYAQESMRKAAEQAGILKERLSGETELLFVPEPEAAALAAFADRKYEHVQCGDIFVICDAGGGTVDLISYEVEETAPLRLKECVPGNADICGSIFIDQEFEKHMQELMGKKKWDKLRRESVRHLNERWEYGIKRAYSHPTPEVLFSIPHEVVSAIKSGYKFTFRKRTIPNPITGVDQMRFQAADIRKIFEPVSAQIFSLIREQVVSAVNKTRKKPTAILLVGGLGSCRYLYQLLDKEYSMRDIELLQPQGSQPWSAICRGAVMKAINSHAPEGDNIPVVTSYIARFHYGITYMIPFQDGVHDQADKRYFAAMDQDLAYNQMQWYVRKGDDMNVKQPLKLPWERIIERPLPGSRFSVKLWECGKDAPPSRKTADVKLRCEIDCPVETPFNELPMHVQRGVTYRKVQFELEMIPTGGNLLDFVAYMNNRRVAQHKVVVK